MNMNIIAVTSGLMAAALVGCASQPSSIVGDNAALCAYSGKEHGMDAAERCRSRLESQGRRLAARNAVRIEGYALLNTPEQPSPIAGQCKPGTASTECGDVTGTIPSRPKP
jgi:hypothetical protein